MAYQKEKENKLTDYMMEMLMSEKQQDMKTVIFFKKIMDEMPGGFFIYRADGDEELIYANAAMLRIFGCDTMEEFQELTGNSFKGIVHPEDLDEVEKSIWQQIRLSHYDLDYVEYRIIRKDGEIRWVEDYGHFIHSEKGDFFYVFAGDATEKKRRREKEHEKFRQEQLRRGGIIEALSGDYESIFYVDLDQNFIEAYRFSERIECQFGKEENTCEFDGFATEYIRRWVCPEDRELVEMANNPEYIRKRLSRNNMFYVNYRIHKGEDKEYLQLRIVNVGKKDHISQIVMGYRSVDSEIMHEMEQKYVMEEALKQAKHANSAKDTFLANMSHDMRTPMNAIMGFTTLAEKSKSDKEKLGYYLDKIATASEQLLTLINDVLELSGIGEGKLQIEETRCSLPEIMRRLEEKMGPKAEARHIRYTSDISEVKHGNIYVDRQKLEKLLLYLADNAVKYTNDGGQVNVRVVESADRVKEHGFYQFIVEDNGIGIDKDFQKHIFEPFERHKNTTLSGVPGSGLGLAIAKNIVDFLNGRIDILSKEGEGSRFTVSLRLRFQKESSNTYFKKETEAAEEKPKKPKRILVVEDNELNLEIEEELLQGEGFLVDTAVNGKIAVEKVENSTPGYYALILMDIQMPVMDGYQASRKIRHLQNRELAGIPIIALSANAFDEDKKKSMESGMSAHVAKPVNILQLVGLINEMCQS